LETHLEVGGATVQSVVIISLSLKPELILGEPNAKIWTRLFQ
jgi:hypothetical protein